MATTWTWAQVISNIQGISTKTTGSSSQTGTNKWGIDTGNGAWMYIPANGYYTTGHWLNIPWNTFKSKLGDADRGHVLNTKYFSSEKGIKLQGNIPSNTVITKTLNPSNDDQTVTIPWGYYSGTGSVKVNKVALSGNADTGHVLSGYTFYKDSMTKKTGTITTNDAINYTFTPTENPQSYTIRKGYYASDGVVKCNPGVSKTEILADFKYASYTCQSDPSSQKSYWYDNDEDAHRQTKYNIHFRPSLGVHRIIGIWYYQNNRTSGGYEWYSVNCDGLSIGLDDPNFISLYSTNVQGSGNGNTYNPPDWATANDVDIYLPTGKYNQPFTINVTYL